MAQQIICYNLDWFSMRISQFLFSCIYKINCSSVDLQLNNAPESGWLIHPFQRYFWTIDKSENDKFLRNEYCIVRTILFFQFFWVLPVDEVLICKYVLLRFANTIIQYWTSSSPYPSISNERNSGKSTTSSIRIFVPNSFRISSNMSLQTELLPKTEEGSIIHFSLCSDRVDTSRKQSGLLWKLYNHHLHTSFIVVVEDGCQ